MLYEVSDLEVLAVDGVDGVAHLVRDCSIDGLEHVLFDRENIHSYLRGHIDNVEHKKLLIVGFQSLNIELVEDSFLKVVALLVSSVKGLLAHVRGIFLVEEVMQGVKTS